MKNRYFVIRENTAKEIVAIINRYIQKYGNITITELLNKMETDYLILD